uniref:Uncharacterized protein n=1 Tax=Arundo donax TaxID=35708 RepID=A0A0A8YZC5_ARUDO
MYVKPLRIRIG